MEESATPGGLTDQAACRDGKRQPAACLRSLPVQTILDNENTPGPQSETGFAAELHCAFWAQAG